MFSADSVGAVRSWCIYIYK